MSKHKWAKEIKAWADGAEIEARYEKAEGWTDWRLEHGGFIFYQKGAEYRIKPQPKEKKYLYVYADGDFFIHSQSPIGAPAHWQYFGKIEVQDD